MKSLLQKLDITITTFDLCTIYEILFTFILQKEDYIRSTRVNENSLLLLYQLMKFVQIELTKHNDTWCSINIFKTRKVVAWNNFHEFYNTNNSTVSSFSYLLIFILKGRGVNIKKNYCKDKRIKVTSWKISCCLFIHTIINQIITNILSLLILLEAKKKQC